MITIYENVEVVDHTTLSSFECPGCSKPVFYRNNRLLQGFCYSCKTILVDAQSLTISQRARIKYHLEGEDAVLCNLLSA